jgi:hypothetical protein
LSKGQYYYIAAFINMLEHLQMGKLTIRLNIEINTILETIRESIKISAKERLGYYELKRHKPNCNGYRIQMK